MNLFFFDAKVLEGKFDGTREKNVKLKFDVCTGTNGNSFSKIIESWRFLKLNLDGLAKSL